MLTADDLKDLTHLGSVHTSTIDGNAMAHVGAKMDTVRSPLGLTFIRWMDPSARAPPRRQVAP
jgi:Vanillate O-demethylase oxygenase C-terminal domain